MIAFFLIIYHLTTTRTEFTVGNNWKLKIRVFHTLKVDTSELLGRHFAEPSSSPQVICDENHFLDTQGGTCCESFSFLVTMVKFVFFGSILHALERHFLTALPFLFQSLNTASSPRRRIYRVLIKRLFLNYTRSFYQIYYDAEILL